MKCFVIFLLLVTGWTARVDALPRYAASYGQSCVLCHQNPTGGGLRTLYATQDLIPRELASRPWPDAGAHNPQIAENLTIGVDLRTLAYQREGGDGEVFAMEGAFYAHVQLSVAASVYLEQGLSGRGEIFGLLYDLDHGVYLKAGRFIPDHGWRFADHQMFTRRFLWDRSGGDNPGFLYDSGLEVGGSKGEWIDFSASALSGRQSHGDNYAGRVLVRHEHLGVRWGLGASVIRRRDAGGHRRAVAGFWYLSSGPFTWLGEVDETSRPDGSEGQQRLGNLLAQELTVRLARGWELRGTYSFEDPNRAEKTGAVARAGAGFSYMPQPYFSVQLMANRWRVESGSDAAGRSYDEAELMIHFFY